MSRFALPLLALLSTAGFAQTPVIGLDRSTDQLFTAEVTDFYDGAVPIGASSSPIRAIDYDASGSTLWGIQSTWGTATYGIFDHGTGAWNPLGPVTGLTGPAGVVSDMTASPNGTDWYLVVSPLGPGSSYLYRGDITTGSFSVVGRIASGDFSGLAMTSSGSLYGFRTYTNALYWISTSTGEGIINNAGANHSAWNGDVGMDYDWSTDILYLSVANGTVSQLVTVGWTGTSTVHSEVQGHHPTEIAIATAGPASVGDVFNCPSNPNSTGVISATRAVGSPYALSNRIELQVQGLPPGQFGYFLASRTIALSMPAGSSGVLCLGGNIVRFNAPSQLLVGPSGAITLDLHAIPTTPPVGVQPGENWSFQAWHRDTGGTSNFSSQVTIGFL